MSDRQDVNRQLVIVLYDLIENNPDLRFSQILSNFGFVQNKEDGEGWKDEFYLEPEHVLNRVYLKIEALKEEKEDKGED